MGCCLSSQPSKRESAAVESLVVLKQEQGSSYVPLKGASDEQIQGDGASQHPNKERILISAGTEQEGKTKNEQLIQCEASTSAVMQTIKVNEEQVEMVQDNQSLTIQVATGDDEPRRQGKVEQLLEKGIKNVEDLEPYTKVDWLDIADGTLPHVISIFELIQPYVPAPGNTAVGVLISIMKLAQKAVCNHQNIKSLSSRLLDLGHILGSHSKKIEPRDQCVRRFLEDYYEVTLEVESYVKSYTDHCWIINVVKVFPDEQRYKALNEKISAVVDLLKLALATSTQDNIWAVLDQVKMLVDYEDSNKKLNEVIEKLDMEELVINPEQAGKLLRQLPPTGQGLAINMMNQVLSMLRGMKGRGPHIHIQQPDLRTFWAITFPVDLDAPWVDFWEHFDELLKEIIAPEELEKVMKLMQSQERLRLQDALSSGDKVSVLDLRFKIPPKTSLADALQATLNRLKVLPTPPGCAPVPLPDNEIAGREDDVRKVVQLLLNNRLSAPAPSESQSLSGCLLLAPGGMGKSRLAVAVAARLNKLGHLKGGGAIFVDLLDASKREDVVDRIYAALSMKLDPSGTTLSVIASNIVAKVSSFTGGVVLVLDNAEGAQNDKESVELLRILFEKMQTIPSRPLLLITSRIPFAGICSYDVKALASDAAATLIRNTLRKLDEEEIQIIVSTCGGVPLTLLIAAKALYAGRISTTDLENAYKEAKAAVDSDRTLRIISLLLSALSLDQQQQRTLLALSVFPSSFDADDAAAVLELPSAADAIWQLDKLLHLSLLNSVTSQNGFLLHPLIRSTLMDIEYQAEEKRGILQRARWMFLLNVLNQVYKWDDLATEGEIGMTMALSLARSHVADIEQALRLLMADELPADVWKTATEKLAQCIKFLKALGLMREDSLLSAASALRRH